MVRLLVHLKTVANGHMQLNVYRQRERETRRHRCTLGVSLHYVIVITTLLLQPRTCFVVYL